MKLKGAHIGILAVVIILGVIGVAFRQQGGAVWSDEAVAAQEAKMKEAAPAKPAADEKCPVFTITAETKPQSVTFTVSPAREGLGYNWSVSAGTVLSGMGTSSIMVDVPDGTDKVLASLDVTGLDASCPKDAGYVSGSAQMP